MSQVYTVETRHAFNASATRTLNAVLDLQRSAEADPFQLTCYLKTAEALQDDEALSVLAAAVVRLVELESL